MAGKVTVGCRLPHGLILRDPMDAAKTVELEGLNKSKIIGSDCMFNEVDADFWNKWVTVNKDFPAVKANVIFVGKDVATAQSIAEEVKGETTGFEAASQTGAGIAPATAE